MAGTDTNRKGVRSTRYHGQMMTGAPRPYVGRQTQGEPVGHLPAGFRISERPNGVASLVTDRPSLIDPVDVAAAIRAEEERSRHYPPVLRFILVDPVRRRFRVERLCFIGGIDDWLMLGQTGPVVDLAGELAPMLGTDECDDLD